MTPPASQSNVSKTGGIADENGEMVSRFSGIMHNLGLNRAGDELVAMLRSERWRSWSQGGMVFEFLPGEFDYFLSQQGIDRQFVMAVPDITVKASLEEAMDERRTGQHGYRRRVADVWTQVPEIPGRPIMPFGYTEREAKALVDGARSTASGPRRPLGDAVRRWTNTGGLTTRKPNTDRPMRERLAASAARLDDDDLELLLQALREEQRRRKLRGLWMRPPTASANPVV